MPLTQYARDQALEYSFTTTTLTRPAVWYASLHTASPGDSGTVISNEFTSGADTSYARQQLTGGNALALTSHIIQNGGAVTWTAGGVWATATFWGICDASSSGNLWGYGELSQGASNYFLVSAQGVVFGSGYAASDTITLTGGGGAVLTVDTVATVAGVAGVPVNWHISNHGSVSSIPSNPMATTSSGSGTGFTCLAGWLVSPQSFQLNNTDSITFASGQLQIQVA